MNKKIKGFAGACATAAGMLCPVTAFAAEETIAQKMGEAAFHTVLGMGTVFIMLIVIALIIYCFRFISVFQKKTEKTEAKPAPQPERTNVVPVKTEPKDDLELVAVIAAAIAASEQIPPDSFVVRTIKRRTA